MLIEVFKTGTHTDSHNHSKTYTAPMLDRLVYNYAAQIEENPNNLAPLVKGHPKGDEPALGWVKKLFRRGQKLIAQIENVSEELVQEIKNDKFKHFSIALYPNMNLRHIGILGAVPPAVQGLNPNGVMGFDSSKQYREFAWSKNMGTYAEAELKKTTKNSPEPPPQTLNENPIDAETKEYLNEHGFEDEDTETEYSETENISDENNGECRAAYVINKLQEANNELLKQVRQLEQRNRAHEFNAYVESVTQNSQMAWTPAQKAAFVEILELANGPAGQKVCAECGHTFAQEAEPAENTAQHSIDLATKIKSFVQSMEFAVPQSDILNEMNYTAVGAPDTPATYSSAPMDPTRAQIHSDALKYQQKHPEMTYAEAVAACLKQDL